MKQNKLRCIQGSRSLMAVIVNLCRVNLLSKILDGSVQSTRGLIGLVLYKPSGVLPRVFKTDRL